MPISIQVAINISNALTTLTATGVPVLIATVPDYGLAPTTQQFLVSAAARQNVADVLDELNLVIHNYRPGPRGGSDRH